VRARLTEPVDNRGGRRHFVRAIVTGGADGPRVRPSGEQGAGVLTALTRANGLLVVPDGVEGLVAGDWVEVEMVHWEQGSGELGDEPSPAAGRPSALPRRGDRQVAEDGSRAPTQPEAGR
jgi:molybdopterin molybdotransferase